MSEPAPVLRRLREILAIPGDRVGKARRVAAAIRESGGYRWVGIYDVASDEIDVVAWSGPAGLDTTRSKIVVPVLEAGRARVVGLLDVESDLPDAFDAEDRRSLEECAAALTSLWG